MTQFFSINNSPMKAPCRVAATSNQTGSYNNGDINTGVGATFTYTATGALQIDGVNLNFGDRVLLQNQTNAAQNGIYAVKVVGDSLTQAVLQRTPDFQSAPQLRAGDYVSIGAGSVNAGFIFVNVEPLPSIIGISNIIFNQA